MANHQPSRSIVKRPGVWPLLLVLSGFFQVAQACGDDRLRPNLDAAPAPLGDSFVGREIEFAQLDQAWTQRKVNMVGVVAWGGFGKSAMVRQWLHRHERAWQDGAEPDGIIWYTVQPRTDAAALYTELVLYFYRDGQQVAGEHAPIHEKLAALKLAIGTRRFLLVLDGLEPLQIDDQNGKYGTAHDPLLSALLRAICRGELGDGLCVVTSRLPLSDVAGFAGDRYVQINLEERLLTDDEAKLLVKLEGVRAGTGEQMARIIKFCQRHPLALKIGANLLKAKAEGDAGAWETLVRDANGQVAEPRNAREAVRIMLDRLRQHLSAHERAAAKLLARVARPLPRRRLYLLAEYEQHLADLSPDEFDLTLASLLALRVADYNKETQMYALHPLVAEYFGGPPGRTGPNP